MKHTTKVSPFNLTVYSLLIPLSHRPLKCKVVSMVKKCSHVLTPFRPNQHVERQRKPANKCSRKRLNERVELCIHMLGDNSLAVGRGPLTKQTDQTVIRKYLSASMSTFNSRNCLVPFCLSICHAFIWSRPSQDGG